MTAGPTSADAVRKSAIVPLAPDQAFETFTSRIAAWWPLATHSVGLADAESVRFEGRLGGRIIESLADGTTSTWGTLTEWDPPHRVRFSWHPGSTEAHATEVEVRFSPRDGGTLVELTHTGWHRRPDGTDARSSYDTGWDLVLGRYIDLASAV